MDFLKYISTPANTTEADPLKTPLRLTAGRLTGGFIHFPAGPSGVLHFIAKIGEHQVLPFNTGDNYCLNHATVPLHLDIDLFEPPYIIDLITWNDPTTNPHALTICLFLDPRKKPRKTKGIIKTLFDGVKGYHKP